MRRCDVNSAADPSSGLPRSVGMRVALFRAITGILKNNGVYLFLTEGGPMTDFTCNMLYLGCVCAVWVFVCEWEGSSGRSSATRFIRNLIMLISIP